MVLSLSPVTSARGPRSVLNFPPRYPMLEFAPKRSYRAACATLVLAGCFATRLFLWARQEAAEGLRPAPGLCQGPAPCRIEGITTATGKWFRRGTRHRTRGRRRAQPPPAPVKPTRKTRRTRQATAPTVVEVSPPQPPPLSQRRYLADRTSKHESGD
jgi:hypothetical protein